MNLDAFGSAQQAGCRHVGRAESMLDSRRASASNEPVIRSELSIALAAADDAPLVASLRNAVATALTKRYGLGHWSSMSSEKGVRTSMKRSSIYIARENARAVATFELATKKPWSIDRQYFTEVTRPLYLLGMAVDPEHQRTGLGRQCIALAVEACRNWPADALCLDAYDSDAGAGVFYQKCGFAEVGRATYRNTPLIYFERLI
jgi:GNAT superfamily N-acetyltransferase